MLEDTATTGSINTTTAEKRLFASKSHAFNLNNPKFQSVFPELCTLEMAPLPKTNVEINKDSHVNDRSKIEKESASPVSESSGNDVNTSSTTNKAIPDPLKSSLTQRTKKKSSKTSAQRINPATATAASTVTNNQYTSESSDSNNQESNSSSFQLSSIISSAWNMVRYNVWRFAVIFIVLYLVALKIMNRIAV